MKQMIKILTSARIVLLTMVFALVASTNVSYAVMAHSEPIAVTQPDGSQLTIRMHGDEFFNYSTTLDGYIVAKNERGLYCHADYNSGKLRVSAIQAGKGLYIGGTKSIPEAVYQKIRETNIDNLIGTKTLNARGSGLQPPRVVVLLVEYPDKRFIVNEPRQAFDNMMNQVDYTNNGAIGSVADYYDISSKGAYRPVFETYGPYTMPEQHSFYFSDWSKHTEDACKVADSEVDFSLYSTSASEVDLVLIYYAGNNPAEAGPGTGVWPHRGNLASSNLILDGKKVTNYACTSELKGENTAMAGIGTMTHEFGHTLGLADLYAVGNTSNVAVDSWKDLNVMNGGNYNNEGRTPPLLSAPQRDKLGWTTLEEINISKVYTLEPLHSSNKGYKIKTDVEGEYYTLENRDASSNKWDVYMGGKGMIIYHMDYSKNIFQYQQQNVTAAQMWLNNLPNSNPAHQCSDLVEATGYEYQTQPKANLFFPGGLNVTSFEGGTKPALASWSGVRLGVGLTNIAISGDNITFKMETNETDYSKAQLHGSVRTVMGVPVRDAKVEIYEVAASSHTTSSMPYGISAKASSTPVATIQTDRNGEFVIVNIEADKDYFVEFKKNGLSDLKHSKKLIKGLNTITATMSMIESNPDIDNMKWYQVDGTTAQGAKMGEVIYIAIRFNPVELRTFEYNQLKSVSVMADNKTTSMQLTIKTGVTDTSNNQETEGTVLVSKLSKSQPEGGLYVFDLMDLNVSKDNTKTLTVMIRVNGGVLIDESIASIPRKGDRVSTDDKIWRRISEQFPGVDGNWIISVQTTGQGKAAPYPAIAVAQGGYKVGDRFMPEMRNLSDNVESVKYTVNGTITPSSGHIFSSSGTYIIVTEIKYTAASGLGTETITRKINIQ